MSLLGVIMSLLTIIIGLGIISLFGLWVYHSLDTMSNRETSKQPTQKKSHGCLALILEIILIVIIIMMVYDSTSQQINSVKGNGDLSSTKSNTPSSAEHSYRSSNNDLSSTKSNTPSSAEHSYRSSNNDLSSTRSNTPSSAEHSYRSPNERSHRWIYDADTGIGYRTGESQCSILSLYKHAMGSNNPHWVTFMITQFPSSAIRIIISDGLYNNIADNQTITMSFSNTSIQVTGKKDGVKLLIRDSARLLDAIKQSNTVTIPVKLKDGTIENLQFDLSSFTSQCPY